MLRITLDNTSVFGSSEVGFVSVPTERIREILDLHLKVETGITLRVVVDDFAMNHFTFVDMVDYNQDLNYPYYVCNKDNKDSESCSSSCGYILGFLQKSSSDVCPLCGSTTRKVVDMYKEGFALDY